jgi:hypothetical protein
MPEVFGTREVVGTHMAVHVLRPDFDHDSGCSRGVKR